MKWINIELSPIEFDSFSVHSVQTWSRRQRNYSQVINVGDCGLNTIASGIEATRG